MKAAIAMFYFSKSKSLSDVMENIFNYNSIYSSQKFPC